MKCCLKITKQQGIGNFLIYRKNLSIYVDIEEDRVIDWFRLSYSQILMNLF